MKDNLKSCNYCSSSNKCNECLKVTFDMEGFEIKCDGKCSKCNCYDCKGLTNN